MKTAKITEIKWVNEWNNPKTQKLTYYFNLKLDNWEEISLGKMNKDAFKLWDTVNYEDYTDDKWKQRQREVRENNFKKTYNPEANNRWAMVWLAYKIAFDKAYNWEDDFNATIQLANRIFEEAMSTYNKKYEQKTEDSAQTDTTTSKEEKDFDLPF